MNCFVIDPILKRITGVAGTFGLSFEKDFLVIMDIEGFAWIDHVFSPKLKIKPQKNL